MAYQDFVGTFDLAQDMDIFRAAVGAETLSVWGVSYGTEVGASYATMFPERVDKLVLDGNVAVSNELYEFAELSALSYEQVWNGLAAACNDDFFVKGTAGLSADDLCAAAPYPTDKIYSIIRNQTDRSFASFVLNQVNTLFEGGGVMHGGVSPGGAVLMACVQSYYTNRNGDGDGCCNFDPQKGCCHTDNPLPPYASGSGRVNEPVGLVRSVDMAGRMRIPTILRAYGRNSVRNTLLARQSDCSGVGAEPPTSGAFLRIIARQGQAAHHWRVS